MKFYDPVVPYYTTLGAIKWERKWAVGRCNENFFALRDSFRIAANWAESKTLPFPV